ncbi:unnamed protein product [Protopolystoma xenopodis]|uniref:Uncharacterized protein n=1 Tax=Protopolystoma xenopodis TaxID=117903 RepID=A0A3S5AL52_9PLAT|nr:unnamed protein product [Protopolystoma xenopodis]
MNLTTMFILFSDLTEFLINILAERPTDLATRLHKYAEPVNHSEDIPQTKLALYDFLPGDRLDLTAHSRSLIYSGTRVLQAYERLHLSTGQPNNDKGRLFTQWSNKRASDPSTIDYGVYALVLRTGYLTTKGMLVRDVLYPRPLDMNFTKDAFRFLSIMAVIAIMGSIYSLVVPV